MVSVGFSRGMHDARERIAVFIVSVHGGQPKL